MMMSAERMSHDAGKDCIFWASGSRCWESLCEPTAIAIPKAWMIINRDTYQTFFLVGKAWYLAHNFFIVLKAIIADIKLGVRGMCC